MAARLGLILHWILVLSGSAGACFVIVISMVSFVASFYGPAPGSVHWDDTFTVEENGTSSEPTESERLERYFEQSALETLRKRRTDRRWYVFFGGIGLVPLLLLSSSLIGGSLRYLFSGIFALRPWKGPTP